MASPLRPLPGGPRSRRRSPYLQWALIAVGALVAVNLLVVALSLGGGEDGRPLPREIRVVVPAPDSTIRPQEDVGAFLIDGYTGILLVDSTELPLDQLKIEPAIGQVTFRPGVDKDITRLAPGPHSATIVFWPQEKSREEAARSYTWQFIAG